MDRQKQAQELRDYLHFCAERSQEGLTEWLFDFNLPGLFRMLADFYASSDDLMDAQIRQESIAAIAARSRHDGESILDILGYDPRVHEVIVHIGYRTEDFDGDSLIELRDYTESIVAQEFAIEQSHVDVRLRPFGPLDDYEEPLFLRIIALRGHSEKDQKTASADLAAQIKEHFHTPFCLWVEFAPATFTEVTNKRGT